MVFGWKVVESGLFLDELRSEIRPQRRNWFLFPPAEVTSMERDHEVLRERLTRLSQASLRINESLDYPTVLQGAWTRPGR